MAIDIDDLISLIEERDDVLAKLGYKVRIDLSDTKESILIDGTGGKAVISRDTGAADTVLKLSSDNLAKLINGKLNPTIAFTTGRLKIDGSRGVALKLTSLLESE